MLRGRAASIKQKQKKNIKQNIERADRDWKYWCKRFRRVNRQFSSSSSKQDGEQYEPKSLRSFALRFDRYLRKKDYSTIIMEGMELRKTKEALVANQKWLKKEGKPNAARMLTDEKVDVLYGQHLLGCSLSGALIKTIYG